MNRFMQSRHTIAAISLSFVVVTVGPLYAQEAPPPATTPDPALSGAPAAPAAPAPRSARYREEYLVIERANAEYNQAVKDLQQAVDAKDYEAYNEALGRAEAAVTKMEKANIALDQITKQELTSQLDTIDRRMEERRQHLGVLGQMDKVGRRAEEVATTTGRRTEGRPATTQGRRAEGTPQVGRTPELERRMEGTRRQVEATRQQEASRGGEKESGGFMSTLGKIWDVAKTVWKTVDAVADVGVGIASMKQGLDRLRNFGKNKQGFFAKFTDIAYGTKQLSWGGQSIQRGVRHLGEVKDKVFPPTGGTTSTGTNGGRRTEEEILLDQGLQQGL
ncbi:MAG: hypothetical protein HY722_08555 [Planctomycetes bacterium]|nr:hypothetical protein [Planctomycetota bacterium]